MTHRPELLSAMLDGETSEAEAAWIKTHLDECGQCRAELDDLATARAAVRGLPMLDLPDGLSPQGTVVRGPWVRRAAVGLSSAAAVAVMAVATLAVLGLGEDPTVVDVTAAEEILAATASLDVSDDGSETAALLIAADRANFRAYQTAACLDDLTLIESSASVTRTGDVTVMADPVAQMKVVVDGSVSTGAAEGPIRTVTVTGDSPTLIGYSIVSVVPDPERERPTEIVTLARDGIERVRLRVDTETGAIVHRELLTEDGQVACVTELTRFEPADGGIQASIPFDIRAEVVETVHIDTGSDLPASLGGLQLLASYPVDGGLVGVYGDGILLVAVLRLDGGAPTLTGETRMPVSVWEADGVSWAVIGSAPADVRAQVAADLPSPDDSNPVVDGWRQLFG